MRYLAAVALATSMATPTVAGPIASESLTDATVQGAIRAITDELYRRRDETRFWEPPTWNPDRDGQQAQRGGYTPLVVLALVHAGESYQDPRLRGAIDHLQSVHLGGTYAISLRAHVWALLPDRFRDALRADATWLIDGFRPQAPGWSYEPTGRWYDNSLAHYGALALWEAAKRDVEIEPKLWQLLEQRFIENQHDDGGWAYREGQPVSGSMTAAGLATLFITQDYLHAHEALALDEARDPRPHETAIARGLEWMDRRFTADANPGKDTYFYYYLYGVERVGLASGYARFGDHDWFRAGTAAILHRLCDVDPDTGTVTVQPRLTGSRASPAQTRQLAFALLFLSRGRVPIAINKLRSDDFAWNNRPRDVANLTRWLTQQTEGAVSWQIVDDSDDPRDWLTAPVLYLASHEAVPFTPQRVEKMKTYLDLGGLLLAVAEGRGQTFTKSIERAAREMYPDTKWERLPPDHWAYTLHFEAKGRRVPLRALSNGVRELIIIAPAGDVPAALQVRDTDRAAPWATAGHVYLYASEMNQPRPRLATSSHRAATTSGASAAPKTVHVARASHQGRWNPEPQALPQLAAWLRRTGGPHLALSKLPLAKIAEADPRPVLVVVSGLDPIKLDDAERGAIRRYTAEGGVILFETPGGRGDFCRSAEQACADLLGAEVQPLLDHPVTAGLAPVQYRLYARQVFGLQDTAPRLRGMVVGDAVRVLFSREDLSQALLDQPCWGIAGYGTGSARTLMANLVRYAQGMGDGG